MLINPLLYTFAHNVASAVTLPAGRNRYVLISVTDTDAYQWGSATFGGVALTKLAESYGQGGFNYGFVQFWGMPIPDGWAGDKSIVPNTGKTTCQVWIFDNVDPANPMLDVDFTLDANTTALSLTVDCTADGYVVDTIGLNGAYTPNNGANQTALNRGTCYGVSRYTTPADGTVTMSWTFTLSRVGFAVISLRFGAPASSGVDGVYQSDYSFM